MLPNFRARWCTRILKIEPTIEYFESLAEGSVCTSAFALTKSGAAIYGEDIKIRFPMGNGLERGRRLEVLGPAQRHDSRRTDCGCARISVLAVA